MSVARGLSTLIALSLWGCFQVRPLDRAFDAGVDGAPVDAGHEAGTQCATKDPTCDGVDDDCDGRYDEDFSGAAACGIGECRTGSSGARCVSGFPIECLPGPSVREECDGLDNDCDGTADEGLTRGCGMAEGLCTRGEERCVEGAWTPCDAVMPVAETCDGRDEDCDGNVDEGLTRGCGEGEGQCGGGSERCQDGAWTGCDAVEPSPEDCNGVDDDCDGMVDEDLDRECGTDDGACSTGRQRCADGAWSACQGGTGPVDELCNDEDDDCDGATDEGDGPCGACALESRPICVGGVDPCPGAGPPMPLCVTELTRLDGAMGDALGRGLADMGDVNGDGIGDFAVLSRRGVRALSGADGEELWRYTETIGEGHAVAAADIGEDEGREVIVVDTENMVGEIIVLDAAGRFRDNARGQDGLRYQGPVVAIDGEAAFAAADPTAVEGIGAIRHFQFQPPGLIAEDTDLVLADLVAVGTALAWGRDGEGRPAMVTRSGRGDERRVLYLGDTLAAPGERADTIIGPAPGVGERLAIGPLQAGGPTLVAALDGAQPWVDVVEPSTGAGGRLPLDRVGADLAILPGRGPAPPLLVILTPSGLRFARIDGGEAATVADFELPEAPPPLNPLFNPAVAVSPLGPDGSRLVALSMPMGFLGETRVYIFRVD